MAKHIRKVKGVVSSVVDTAEGSHDQERDIFNEQLQDELDDKAKSQKKAVSVKKEMDGDAFTKMVMGIFDLEAVPAFREEYCDSRWPRIETGGNLFVTRCYFPSVAKDGNKSEMEQVRFVVDRIPKDVEKKVILARKWTLQESGYLYVWIQEGENIEFDPADKTNEVFKRLRKMTDKPVYTYGPLQQLMSVYMGEHNGVPM